nr:Glycoside hydrolase, family 2, Beta-galactosidase [uncultured bacterium]
MKLDNRDRIGLHGGSMIAKGQIIMERSNTMKPMRWILGAILLLALGRPDARAAEAIWIEGEASASINVKPNIAGWGHPEFLSEEKWLHLSLEPGKPEVKVPEEGVRISYKFQTPAAATYEIWNRIGFEFVRSPFEWRLDGGAWTEVRPEELTTDCMELDTWCEVAWLRMGERPLAAGEHTLEIHPKAKEAQGKKTGGNILYASDALCIYPGKFHPNSKLKPGQARGEAIDAEAAKLLFTLPEHVTPGERAAVKLAGTWEVCRDDEAMPLQEVATPIKALPSDPIWTGIPVPGDKNELRPDLLFAHRIWYRTRVSVPASQAGRGFFITFPQNNLNTTVYVNGQLCGFNKNPFARFSIDVSKAVKPGLNEVCVGIRDAWYGYTASPADPMKLRKVFNLPVKYLGNGFQDFAYPIWNHAQSGMLFTPEFVAAGPVYVEDIFAKPSVSKKELGAEITLLNPAGREARGELRWEALDPKSGKVEKTFAPQVFTVAANSSATLKLAERWEAPRLWWPDDPQMTHLRVSLAVDGKIVDTTEQPFGFREWSWAGKDFKLNGIPWHGWADCLVAPTREAWLDFYRKSNQKMTRFWGTDWKGLEPGEALDFFDVGGVVVRRSGMLDGQAIGNNAIENDEALRKLYNSKIKMVLMENWRDQMLAQVRGERNHPAIMIWSLENEWLYINCLNLHAGEMDQFEKAVTRVSDAVLAADPTRPTMTDGGGANKDQSMPVHGNHYVFDQNLTRYPGLAYEAFPEGGGRGRWVWDQQRPRFIGEDYFANGINPAEYSIFGGEAPFQGKAQARPAAGVIFRMLTEGYRWAGYGGWHFWMSQNEAENQYGSNAWRAVFCRQWDWTFGSGQQVPRTFAIFNDTRFDDPITFVWTLTVGSKKVAGHSAEYRVAPGTNQKIDASLAMPVVSKREEGELTLTLTVGGKQVFSDVKKVSVLNPRVKAEGSGAKRLLVFDPKGEVSAYLKTAGVAFTALDNLENLPADAKALLIGREAIDEREATSSRLAAWASEGRSIVVLEQVNPLKYQALPAEMEPASADSGKAKNRGKDAPAEINEGRIAWGEDFEHPVLRGLEQKDFFTWGPDEVVYRRAYTKPARGGKSLVQCGPRLLQSALVEVPAGKGVLLVSQLVIGEKLGGNAVAQQLMANLLNYATDYTQEFRQVAVAAEGDPLLVKALEGIGLRYQKAAGPLEAIGDPEKTKLAIVAASPANLKALAANLEKLQAFNQAGGFLVLHGLTPEGLADYNKIVGFEHMIRPFWRERVSFPAQKHPLTSGLTTGDIVMLSGKRIFGWTSDEYVADDVFSYAVDLDDVAPFMKFPNDFARNMVNGMTNADGWPYIVNIPQKEADWTLRLPKAQELTELTWIGNRNYNLPTGIELTFDDRDAIKFTVQPNDDPQILPIQPPRTASKVRLRITDVAPAEGKRKKGETTGLDNIAFKAARPADFGKRVRPMLNIGALVEYPRGQGGIVLCNLLFKESEAVPLNGAKKNTILAAILRNLKAPFAGRTVIAGAKMTYDPVDLSKSANQYRDERGGWFGDAKHHFGSLPTGRQTFAGVQFEVFHFQTSPVPNCLMVGGKVASGNPDKVAGIVVGRKADALFFLQAAHITRRRNENDIRKGMQFALARYVIHYVDGQTAEVPIYSEVNVENYKQDAKVLPIAGGQVAWSAPYPDKNQVAAAYTMQWSNPRPEVEIKSIDLVLGPEKRGELALLALTAARVD